VILKLLPPGQPNPVSSEVIIFPSKEIFIYLSTSIYCIFRSLEKTVSMYQQHLRSTTSLSMFLPPLLNTDSIGAGLSADRIPVGARISEPVKNGSGAHSASLE
jgi:hypothetical protein